MPYLYRCSGGAVTVGVGHAVASADECCQLAWTAPAAPAEIRAAFAKVAAAPEGQTAAAYARLTSIRMAASAIDDLLANDVVLFEAALGKALPRWNTYPEPAQQALFDMAYNLGIAGLRKFRKLLAGVDAGRWEDAAAQCHRAGIAEARNAETAALFRSC